MKKIAIIGECMIELYGEPFGTMVQGFGGDTLNTAIYLSRITLKTQSEIYYISALGTDNLSQKMVSAWQREGINTQYVLRDKQHLPGLYLIQVDKQGERTFLYWRSQSAATYMLQHTDFPKILDDLATFDLIYLSGISLAILPKNDRTFLIKRLGELVQQGVELAFDGNYRPKLWQSSDEARSAYNQLLPFVQIALLTFDDEQQLWGDRNVTQTLSRVHNIGIPKVVLKQGKDGAIFSQEEKVVYLPAEYIENVVDTTSAGDAFNAGFLNGYLQGKDALQCCQQGNQLAAVVIQHRGAVIDPSLTMHFLTEFN